MGTSDGPRRVHFQSPENLVERLDAIADVYETDRTDLLVDAIRNYITEMADDESFQNLVASKYYDEQIVFQTVKRLVGAETAQRLRILKADLESAPLDLDSPRDIDIYGGERTTVDPSPDTSADGDDPGQGDE